MRYFLDTNILIFIIQNNSNLNKDVISILRDYENILYVSSEVVKETMHLILYNKIEVKQWKNPNDIWKSINEWNIKVDYVKEEHLKTLGNLNPAKDHKDPADHIIIAQAITNKMPIISSGGQNTHEKNKISR
jgi:PIN domain nuclease of toxin-antitoxin system